MNYLYTLLVLVAGFRACLARHPNRLLPYKSTVREEDLTIKTPFGPFLGRIRPIGPDDKLIPTSPLQRFANSRRFRRANGPFQTNGPASARRSYIPFIELYLHQQRGTLPPNYTFITAHIQTYVHIHLPLQRRIRDMVIAEDARSRSITEKEKEKKTSLHVDCHNGGGGFVYSCENLVVGKRVIGSDCAFSYLTMRGFLRERGGSRRRNIVAECE